MKFMKKFAIFLMLLAIQKKNTIFLNNLIINTSNKQKLKLILYLISNMINNHHRDQYFFTKIKRILISLKDEIQPYISNQEIFNFFKKSKIALLFLIESNIITFDESIVSLLKSKYKSAKYPQYFFKEIKSFLPKELEEEISKEIPENYEDQRLIGENDSLLCQLIQNDSIEEFAIYVNKTNTSLFSEIKPSIFETNLIFLKEKPTLIEYATFYGSIQVVQFLYMNKVDLSSSLWIYAIHSLKA